MARKKITEKQKKKNKKEYMRLYYIRNKKTLDANSKAWIKANLEHRQNYLRAWREANPDLIQKYRDKDTLKRKQKLKGA